MLFLLTIRSHFIYTHKFVFSLLYKAASEGLSQMYQNDLWNSKCENSLENNLLRLKHVFISDILDVRLYGVKYFKKGIYEILDRLYITCTEEVVDSNENITSERILIMLSKMLLDCVVNELCLEEREYKRVVHVPTLRRLSRCFLETVYVIPVRFLTSLDFSRELWTISNEIVSREKPSLLTTGSETDASESNGGTLMSSNAIEMMAIAIAIGQHENGTDECCYHEQMEVLLNVVTGLNDPLASWRSRYSAAVALKVCCRLISWNDSNGIDDKRQTLRRKVLMHILKMLQDSDPDVRTEAVRATTVILGNTSIKEGETEVVVCHLLLPERALESVFNSTISTFSIDNEKGETQQQYSTIKSLLSMILDHSQGIINTIINVESEFEYSNIYCNNVDRQNEGLEDLVNVSTTRKIFEEENPNHFEEDILLNQLSILSLLDLQQKVMIPLPTNAIYDVLVLCDSVLSKLFENQTNGGGVMHDFSRFPTIFPSLHSIICASIVVIDLVKGSVINNKDGDNTCSILQSLQGLKEKIQNSSERLLVLSTSTSNAENFDDENAEINISNQSLMHPAILSALRVLARTINSKSDEYQPKEEVIKLLFLLKSPSYK